MADPISLLLAGTSLAVNYGLASRGLDLIQTQTREGIRLQSQGAVRAAEGQLLSGRLAVQAAELEVEQRRSATGLLLKQVDIARLAGDYALVKGLLEENRSRANVERVLATQRAEFGERHLDPTFGSPLLLQAQTASQGEVDARLIRAGAEMDRAEGIARAATIAGQAAGSQFQETAALMRGSQSLTAAIFGAGTAAITGQAEIFKTLSGALSSSQDVFGKAITNSINTFAGLNKVS